MKKRFLIPAIALLAVLGAGLAYAAGGTASDPLISLQYLDGTYTDTILNKAETLLDKSDDALLESAKAELNARLAALGLSADTECALSFTESRFKQDDIFLASTGTSVIPLAGTVTILFDSGAVVDVTTGKTVESGTVATAAHRYMAAENTTARFVTTSKTSVMQYMGYYAVSASNNRADYNAMAEALKQLTLMRGSSTAYGSGFDLENAPTRGAAMIMFIRMLGEEEEALAYTGDCPFTDVPKTSATYPYVAYAYHKGYTNGYSATTFRPKYTTNERQYTEFILRAMGYSSFTNTELDGTLANAVASGVITEAEKCALENNSFLRADLVYLSYYALQATMPDGADTLADQLMEKGVFSPADYRSARQLVSSERIG
ncbi:MAG: S-layer homology domain-containing protein [Oscillospiraceae bacterium]|nr:S-layer homology domain-containing protein [Oscillospiraceae bacterium]